MAKIDTASGLVEAFAASEVKPPAHMRLRDIDRPFFDAIIGARSAKEWDSGAVVLAVKLAQVLADSEDYKEKLDLYGPTQLKPDGIVIAHPLVAIIDQLRARELSYYRALQIDATTLHGQRRDVQGRRELDKKIRDTKASADDSLIPGVRH